MTEIKFYIETRSKYQKLKMHDVRSLILDPIWAPDKGANRFVSFTFSIVSPDILLINPIQ